MDVTKTAPLLLNPSFSLHKYSWLMEFLGHIKTMKPIPGNGKNRITGQKTSV